MPTLIATFDDGAALELALSRLAEVSQVATRVIEALAHRDEQPLPPEVGGFGYGVPIATPTAATGRDVAPGDEEPHPEGMQAATLQDLEGLTAMDREAAERYRQVVADGGSVLVVEGTDESLDQAERIVGLSQASNVGRFS